MDMIGRSDHRVVPVAPGKVISSYVPIWAASLPVDKPVWKYWLNLAEVTVDEAVCLSLDVEPSILDELDERRLAVDRRPPVQDFRVNFVLRRDAARSHIRARRLHARYDGPRRKNLVALADFRTWGESLPAPFSFPREFPRDQAGPEPAVADTPGSRESSSRAANVHLRIIGAMLALLRNPDGGGFPSDAKVIDVLVEKYGTADGISKRNLEAVFAAVKRIAGDNGRLRVKHRK